jgi:hypothetical protein
LRLVEGVLQSQALSSTRNLEKDAVGGTRG